MSVPSKFLFIIGSAKTGTSSLANWLGSRPDMVLGRIKEPRYFTNFSKNTWRGPGGGDFGSSVVKEWDEYQNNFAGKHSAEWAVDASTDLIWCEASPNLLRQFCDAKPAKLICITRDPVERAISEYNHTLAAEMEELSFKEAVMAEGKRARDFWQPLFYHQRRSRVLEDIQRYKAMFGDDLLVLDYKSLQNPEALNWKISDFMGIEFAAFSDISDQNRRKLPKNKISALILRQEALKKIGRKLLSSEKRASIRAGLEDWSGKISTVSAEEVCYFRDSIRDEIDACVQSDLVDTSNWKLALGG